MQVNECTYQVGNSSKLHTSLRKGRNKLKVYSFESNKVLSDIKCDTRSEWLARLKILLPGIYYNN